MRVLGFTEKTIKNNILLFRSLIEILTLSVTFYTELEKYFINRNDKFEEPYNDYYRNIVLNLIRNNYIERNDNKIQTKKILYSQTFKELKIRPNKVLEVLLELNKESIITINYNTEFDFLNSEIIINDKFFEEYK